MLANNSRRGGIQEKHTFVSLPIYVPGKFYDISGHWQRLLVNLSYLIKYIYNKNHLGGRKTMVLIFFLKV